MTPSMTHPPKRRPVLNVCRESRENEPVFHVPVRINQQVFDTALDRFHEAYRKVRGGAYLLPSEREEAHAEALVEAVEAAIFTYMAGAAR